MRAENKVLDDLREAEKELADFKRSVGVRTDTDRYADRSDPMAGSLTKSQSMKLSCLYGRITALNTELKKIHAVRNSYLPKGTKESAVLYDKRTGQKVAAIFGFNDNLYMARKISELLGH